MDVYIVSFLYIRVIIRVLIFDYLLSHQNFKKNCFKVILSKIEWRLFKEGQCNAEKRNVLRVGYAMSSKVFRIIFLFWRILIIVECFGIFYDIFGIHEKCAEQNKFKLLLRFLYEGFMLNSHNDYIYKQPSH